MNLDLVFEGGGVLGIIHVGVYKALIEHGYSVQRCAGTSAGSVISALIIAGYTPLELENIILGMDFNIFNKKTKLGRIPFIGEPLSIIYNKGIYNCSSIETFMNKLLEAKGISKFKDVMSDGKSNLKMVASDITACKMLILPDDLVDYGLDPSEFSIAKAVAMSCAIPYYFTPIKLKNRDDINYIVDGGLLSNFPVWIFDIEGSQTQETFGVKIKNLRSNTSMGKTDIISYTKDIIDAPLNQDESNFVRNKDLERTISIGYSGEVRSTDFAKVNEYTRELVQNGYDSAVKFLEKFNTDNTPSEALNPENEVIEESAE